ncbi:MAG: hypothetical protein QXE80_03700 [Pyrobaculum sp.]
MVKKVLLGLTLLAACTTLAAVFGYWYTSDGAVYLSSFGRVYIMWTNPTWKDSSYKANLAITVDSFGGITIWLLGEDNNLKLFDGATVSVSLYTGNKKSTLYTITNVPFDPSGAFIVTSNYLLDSRGRYLQTNTIASFVGLFGNADKIEVKITTPRRSYTYYYSPLGLYQAILYLYSLSSLGL